MGWVAGEWFCSFFVLARGKMADTHSRPTHTQNLESRSHRPRAWCVCVWVWVGSHTNCTGVVGCACPTSCRHEKQESTRSSVKQDVELISEMMILERRLVQVG